MSFFSCQDEGCSTSSTSSTSAWPLNYEKPKTSEKCYKKRKISLSFSSDSDSEVEPPGASLLEDTNAIFEKLIQSNPVKKTFKGDATLAIQGGATPTAKGVSPPTRKMSPRGSPLKYSPDKCEGKVGTKKSQNFFYSSIGYIDASVLEYLVS